MKLATENRKFREVSMMLRHIRSHIYKNSDKTYTDKIDGKIHKMYRADKMLTRRLKEKWGIK